MKIEEQVLNIEQMQHLKGLGLDVKDTALCIAKVPYLSNLGWREYYKVALSDDIYDLAIPTLTIQEILKMLPKEIVYKGKTYSLFINYPTERGYEIGYDFAFDCPFFEDGKDPLIVSYKLLCSMVENGYLKE